MFPNSSSYSREMANDKGLAAYMRTVFNYMTGGVALSGLVAYFTLTTPALLQAALNPATQILFLVVWFGLGIFFHKLAFKVSPTAALGLFGVYSVITGFALAPVMLMHASMDITVAFFAAAGVFAAASLYGYSTNKSLASLGSFLAVGGIALIIFMVVLFGMAIFGGGVPSGLSLVFSFLVVPFVTIGVAYKINMLRDTYVRYSPSEADRSRLATTEALGFYTDFVVLFLHILNIISSFSNR